MMRRIFASGLLCGQGVLTLWVGALSLSAPVPMAHADAVPQCVIVRARDYGDGQELYNRCDGEVEVTWCTFDDNGCSRYNNQWTLGAGDSHPIGRGRVQLIACAGRNSVSSRGPKQIVCE